MIEAIPIPGFREPVCSLSHLGGAVVFAVLGVFLIRRGKGSRRRTASLAVLWFSSVLLLSLSGVYHLLEVGTARDVMKRLDIAGVFVLIAATVTPLHLILFRGLAAWGPVLFVWFLAAVGITFRMVFFESFPRGLNEMIFLAIGWGGAIAASVLWRRRGFKFIRPLVLGGLAYTLGVVILTAWWPVLIPGVIGPHEIWHIAVLVGLGLHWRFVFQICSDEQRAASSERKATSGEQGAMSWEPSAKSRELGADILER